MAAATATPAQVPGRSASGMTVDDFNRYIRSQQWYQDWFRQRGLDPNHVKLDGGQRNQLQNELMAHGLNLPSGMKIDEAGNLNQKNTLGRNIAIGAGIAGAAATGFGLAGMGPLAGIGGGTLGAGEASTTLIGTGGLIPGISTGAGVVGAAAPVVAGAGGSSILNRISGAAGDLSPILGGAAASESAANTRESSYNLNEDQLNLDRFKTDQALPGQRLNTAVKASRVANITPAKFEWGGPGSVAAGQMPHYTGGDMNPDLINQDTKDLANNVSHQALLDQLNGVASPKATPYKPPTTTGKVIGAGATGASILSRILHWL